MQTFNYLFLRRFVHFINFKRVIILHDTIKHVFNLFACRGNDLFMLKNMLHVLFEELVLFYCIYIETLVPIDTKSVGGNVSR